MTQTLTRLSKSRFTSGLQCHKKLCWEIHEPDAPELNEEDIAGEFFMQRGIELGALARTYAPGELIDFPYDQFHEKVQATADALAREVPRIYEACFVADGVFVAIDILERDGPRFTVVEVKSSVKVKEAHVADVAIQTYVARQAGVNVTRAAVMHLNSECVFPDLSNLFVRTDITPLIETYQLDIPALLVGQVTMLAGPVPEVPIGAHCFSPRDCPFMSRCWNEVPEHHITTLQGIGQKGWDLLAEGHATILDLPSSFKLSAARARQLRAVRQNAIVVEPALGAALAKLACPIAYLDFETIMPAVPVWNGCSPYDSFAVQFSCHIEDAAGHMMHLEYLAEGPGDPRPAMAETLVEACRGAKTVLMYSSFERVQIRRLADAVPALRDELVALDGRLVDLKTIVKAHVYHPAFDGSFSLGNVLLGLVPELSYDDLEVNDGKVANALLNRMLLRGEPDTPAERASLRAHLLAYCRLDTWAMVKLVERLRELSGRQVLTDRPTARPPDRLTA